MNSDSPSTTMKQSDAIKLPPSKPLLKLSNAVGLCASRHHVAVWDHSSVYTWGTNHGQLGHSDNEKKVSVPKQVVLMTNSKEEAIIKHVGASDGATVIATCRGDVYLLHKCMRKKIAIKQMDVAQVSVEARVNEHGDCLMVTVLVLKALGHLHIWQTSTNKLTRCVFGLNHQISISNVALTHNAIYFTTKLGEAYVGNISRKIISKPATQAPQKEKSTDQFTMVTFLEKDDCTMVKIKRIPNVHRGVAVVADSEGVNFGCLQVKPSCGLTSFPELSPSNLGKHMATLLETASEDDLLHDVQFKVGSKIFPAHIFIVASCSEHLYNLYQNAPLNLNGKRLVELENVHPDVFERILRFMYTGTCDVTELGVCSLKLRKEDLAGNKNQEEIDIFTEDIDNPSDISAFEVYNRQGPGKRRGQRKQNAVPRYTYCDPVKLVQAAAKRLQVMALHRLLNRFFYKEGNIYLKESASPMQKYSPSWDRNAFLELVDTYVSSKDDVLIPAHKCILAARLDYFHGMFSHSWCESETLSTVKLHINHGILQPVIDFLYTDSCKEVEQSDSTDFICSLLIIADQLFISRLKEKCEIALTNIVTLRNCAELCQFAHTYNAGQLKRYCMEFISWNMSCLLENRSLDMLEDKLLHDITVFYCSYIPNMSSRIITPFSNAPTDEEVQECAKNCPVDLNVIDEECKKADWTDQNKVKGRQHRKSGLSESEKARIRHESVSSLTSLDVSDNSFDSKSSVSMESKECDNKGKWIKIPTTQQKQQKNTQTRLKAIMNAKDSLEESCSVESYTKLTKDTSFANSLDKTPLNTSQTSTSSDQLTDHIARSPPGCLIINHLGPKMSQKQRKKLALKGEQNLISLEDYLNNTAIEENPKPKNPWKICEAPIASSSPSKSDSLQFEQILADQKKQKDDYSRIMTKPLGLTQLEDKAIEELEKFYNVHEVDDELITVRRIELQVSSPQWIHNTTK